MDEFGNYDVPALIDYILKTTNHEQIMYVGHSQGNMVFYIMCHNRPEYANKVKLFVNLSPVATLNNFPHPWLGMIAPHVKALQVRLFIIIILFITIIYLFIYYNIQECSREIRTV